ncbi:MAG: ABC transporter ATP-binding protein [Acidimicrobiia bacterium]|nr:ABC transporter ATP-binding protein [Acidimicrobiia bacterium]
MRGGDDAEPHARVAWPTAPASGPCRGGAPIDPVLEVDGISKRFGELQAVDSVTFRVAPGETYGLLGPNGAGKSTCISMIAALLTPDAGTIRVLGQEMTTSSTAGRAQIGLVPQEVAVYPDLTARENLRFFGRLYDITGGALNTRVDQILDVIGLTERADDRSSEFSGGMNRRLNIGIGLLHQPQLLILDEPTVGVDPQSRNAILDSVEQLSAEGMAVLYTTHYMEEAERLCDRIGIIDAGKLKAEGTRRELTTSVGERDRVQVGVSGSLEPALDAVRHLDGVTSASTTDDGITLITDDAGPILARVLDAITGAGGSVTTVEVSQPDLEAVFLHLTGKALRD